MTEKLHPMLEQRLAQLNDTDKSETGAGPESTESKPNSKSEDSILPKNTEPTVTSEATKEKSKDGNSATEVTENKIENDDEVEVVNEKKNTRFYGSTTGASAAAREDDDENESDEGGGTIEAETGPDAGAIIIVASDGVWEFMRNNDVARLVLHERSTGAPAQEVAKRLVGQHVVKNLSRKCRS